MASVDVVNVRKSYGGFEVIHGVTAAIADGEFVTLVGHGLVVDLVQWPRCRPRRSRRWR